MATASTFPGRVQTASEIVEDAQKRLYGNPDAHINNGLVTGARTLTKDSGDGVPDIVEGANRGKLESYEAAIDRYRRDFGALISELEAARTALQPKPFAVRIFDKEGREAERARKEELALCERALADIRQFTLGGGRFDQLHNAIEKAKAAQTVSPAPQITAVSFADVAPDPEHLDGNHFIPQEIKPEKDDDKDKEDPAVAAEKERAAAAARASSKKPVEEEKAPEEKPPQYKAVGVAFRFTGIPRGDYVVEVRLGPRSSDEGSSPKRVQQFTLFSTGSSHAQLSQVPLLTNEEIQGIVQEGGANDLPVTVTLISVNGTPVDRGDDDTPIQANSGADVLSIPGKVEEKPEEPKKKGTAKPDAVNTPR